MRLKIRPEQMSVIQIAAETSFIQRLAAHLRENYGGAIVHLPEKESRIVAELTDETLNTLVNRSIERARSYGLSHESAIAAFSALMFEIAPNFDTHRLSRLLLNDENTEPHARIDELLEVLTEKNWETIKSTYDAEAWQFEDDSQSAARTNEE